MIKILDRYIIDASSDCFTVCDFGISAKTGKPYERNKTYHDTLEQCFMNIYKRETRRELSSKEWNVEAYLGRIQTIRSDLIAVFEAALTIEFEREQTSPFKEKD